MSFTVTYIRFYHGMKAQGMSRDTLGEFVLRPWSQNDSMLTAFCLSRSVYRSPLQPYLSYAVLGFFCLVILGSAFSVFMVSRAWLAPCPPLLAPHTDAPS